MTSTGPVMIKALSWENLVLYLLYWKGVPEWVTNIPGPPSFEHLTPLLSTDNRQQLRPLGYTGPPNTYFIALEWCYFLIKILFLQVLRCLEASHAKTTSPFWGCYNQGTRRPAVVLSSMVIPIVLTIVIYKEVRKYKVFVGSLGLSIRIKNYGRFSIWMCLLLAVIQTFVQLKKCWNTSKQQSAIMISGKSRLFDDVYTGS